MSGLQREGLKSVRGESTSVGQMKNLEGLVIPNVPSS